MNVFAHKRAIFAAVLIAVFALGSPLNVRAADPYEINVILPLTGPSAFLGGGIAKTLGVVEELANKQGGVKGRPVKFVIQDDQSSPQVALQLTNGLIAKKVPVILGSTIGAMCQAQAPAVKDGPVLWCFSPAIHPAPGSYVFTTAQTTEDYVNACFRYAKGRGWHKIAVIATTDASGQDFDAGLDHVLSKPEYSDQHVVARDHFNITDLSAAAQVTRAKSSGADVLLTWATGTALGTLLRSTSDAGLDLPVFSTPSNLIWSQLRSLGSTIPSEFLFPATAAYAPNQLPAGPLKRAVTQYIDALHAHGMEPDQSTAVPWNQPFIVIAALNKYGPEATASQIREYIASYKGPGVMGQYDFSATPQRGLDASTVMIIRYDKARQELYGVSGFGGVPLRSK